MWSAAGSIINSITSTFTTHSPSREQAHAQTPPQESTPNLTMATTEAGSSTREPDYGSKSPSGSHKNKGANSEQRSPSKASEAASRNDDHQDAGVAKKRGRGRPPKAGGAAKAGVVKKVSSGTGGKRGRPKGSSNKARAPAAEKSASIGSRGRGRPTKTVTESSGSGEEGSEEKTVPAKTTSRGRGRPPAGGAVKAKSSSASPAKTTGSGRGRGRPPGSGKKSSETKAASPKKAGTGKRGRPPKAAGAKGRGRPKKSAASESEGDHGETTHDEEDEQMED